MNFWKQLHTPFFVLAPMENVTDAAFRSIIAKHSKEKEGKYVTFTEFTSADGIVCADVKGQKKLRKKLQFEESERPIVAQIFSAIPKHIKRAASLVQALGFDGVDINMGCPDRTVEKQGAGAALIKNPKLAQEIIYAAKDGAGNLPVSVKTRVGYAKEDLGEWLPGLLEANPAAITLHARTRKELSKVPAKWDLIARAVEIRDSFHNSLELWNEKTLIIGNGDVRDIAHGEALAKESGADGVMVGRSVFGNPWAMSSHTPMTKEKLEALIEHTRLFEREFTGIKSFATMRKHFSSYVEGFPGARELRVRLMGCNTAAEVENVISEHQRL